jgi:predicted nucleotide-binding protein
MARLTKKKVVKPKAPAHKDEGRKNRNYPKHTLEQALVLAQKIQDEMGGAPMNRLLLANAVGLSPSSSNFKFLLSSAYKYGLTEGTEKADLISLTPVGGSATQQTNQLARLAALRRAALHPKLFADFFRNYSNKKLPSADMLPRILTTQYAVPSDTAEECAGHISTNGKFVDIVRDISGSAHILIDAELAAATEQVGDDTQQAQGGDEAGTPQAILANPAPAVARPVNPTVPPSPPRSTTAAGAAPKPIFVGHGKNKTPLQQLQALLAAFQIPHKVVVDEPHLGRPISQKVKDAIGECGSAILIFTRDEKFKDATTGDEVWRPSENVVYELGATSYTYGDRIVIFKEKGLNFPTNFQNIGYIEFEPHDIAARAADLLKELIGFGLVKVTPT